MGMYSYFDDEDIKVLDWDGLLCFLEFWSKKFPDDSIKGINMIKKMSDNDIINDRGERFTFEGWDDIKLISYWYDSTQLFLKMIAKYITGQVNWTFENNDEAGYVVFEDGICVIHTGVMDWNESEPHITKELLKDEDIRKFMFAVSVYK